MTFAIRKRNRLPHWDVGNGIYFVTTNLADAIPCDVRVRLGEERQAYVAEAERRRGTMTRAEEFVLHRLMDDRMEEVLDDGAGACWLALRDVGQMVGEAIAFHDEKKYELFAWCVMPNHIHLLFRLLASSIANVMKSLKTYTAREANLVLNRSGPFWQADYFDRTIRNDAELLRVVDYIENNPRRADWPWLRVYQDRLPVAGPEVRRLRTGGPRSGNPP